MIGLRPVSCGRVAQSDEIIHRGRPQPCLRLAQPSYERPDGIEAWRRLKTSARANPRALTVKQEMKVHAKQTTEFTNHTKGKTN